MPRTYVRVSDDSGAALQSGAAVDAVLATQTGALAGAAVARDIVVTDGPMIGVEVAGMAALGRTVAAAGGPVTLTVKLAAPDWAEFDTLEVFANTTPGPVMASDTTLVPLKCWTSRALAGLAAADPCKRAALAPEAPPRAASSSLAGEGI
jgi:hypothetical protein